MAGRPGRRGHPAHLSHDGELAAAWDEWHLAHEREERASPDPLPLAEWRELAKGHLPDLTGLRVLDVGCARGGFAQALAARGAEVTAVDISPAAVALARELLGDRGDVRIADAQALPFADESFDVAVALETPHHVAAPEALLSELVRVTRRPGRIVVSAQNHLSLAGAGLLLMRLLRRRTRGAPVSVRLTLPRLLLALRRCGCRIDAVDGGSHLIVLPGFPTRRVRALERVPGARFLAFHVCVAATRR